MILPSNGKIAIIDDKYDEVKHLMQALVKENMPFLFYTDQSGEDLPEPNNPVENIRLVFLDFDLGVSGLGEMEMIRVIQARLERILQKKTPYVLIYWSNHEDKLASILEAEFENDFNEYKPLAKCSLDKSVISRPENNIVETIRENLAKCLLPLESFNAFLFWESAVNKSGGDVVNMFTKIFDLNHNWDNNIKALFYRLAKANIGETKVVSVSDIDRLRLALETINSVLIDIAEKNIREKISALNLNVNESGSNISQSNLVSINTKLHIQNSTELEHFVPGNIYFPLFSDAEMVNEIIKSTFEKGVVEEIINSSPTTIKIDITPVCDYSQDKGYTRLLSGVLINAAFKARKKSSTPIFIYDLCPIITIKGNDFYPVFDFRFSKSLKQETVKLLFPSLPDYKIRHQLLTDLQAGLSNHINRPGIVNIL